MADKDFMFPEDFKDIVQAADYTEWVDTYLYNHDRVQYEYYFDCQEAAEDLQEFMESGRGYPHIGSVPIIGAMSGSEGITSLIFATRLTPNQENKLLDYMLSRYPNAEYWKMEIVS